MKIMAFHRPSLIPLGLLLMGATLALTGCSDLCRRNTDCPRYYICVDQACLPPFGLGSEGKVPVEGDSPCGGCPVGECVEGRCMVPEPLDQPCLGDDDCLEGQCYDGQCMVAVPGGCSLDEDCYPGYCVGGACVPDPCGGCQEGSYCSAEGGCLREGLECGADGECTQGRVCYMGFCLYSCDVGWGCPWGEYCMDQGYCWSCENWSLRPPQITDDNVCGFCSTDAECLSGHCHPTEGVCIFVCEEDRECGTEFRCDRETGRCVLGDP